jgi:hypothetical protein
LFLLLRLTATTLPLPSSSEAASRSGNSRKKASLYPVTFLSIFDLIDKAFLLKENMGSGMAWHKLHLDMECPSPKHATQQM